MDIVERLGWLSVRECRRRRVNVMVSTFRFSVVYLHMEFGFGWGLCLW